MKKIIFTIICFISFLFCNAQVKNRIVIGGDLLSDLYPSIWHSKNVKISNKFWGPFTSSNFWINYTIRNNYCLRLNYSYLALSASYTPVLKMPNKFITVRMATFHDLVIGKNILKNILPKHSGGWIFAGAGTATDLVQMRGRVNPWDTSELIVDESRRRSSLHFYPTVQAMYKYDFLPFAFAGAGFTYRYLYSDFNQMSFNFTLGLQI